MPDKSAIMNQKYAGLRRFNLIMGFLHLIQGVFMILVSNDTTYPIYTNYLKFDTATFTLSPNSQLLYELPFGPAVAMFLLISAVAHFYLSTIGYGRYVEILKKGMNPVRFYEYALSSSLMIVLIGMLIGLWDLGAIILIFTLNGTMNLFGIMMELHNQYTKKVNWTSFIFGCIAGVVPWVVCLNRISINKIQGVPWGWGESFFSINIHAPVYNICDVPTLLNSPLSCLVSMDHA